MTPISTAAIIPPHASPMRRISFTSSESLSNWLDRRLVGGALASWGAAPGTKPLHNLWLEITRGECSIQFVAGAGGSSPGHPVREVDVAALRILNSAGCVLVESHQLLSNGTVRHRNRPLSEKMLPGESISAAAARAVREELGEKVEVEILLDTYHVKVEEGGSMSYPGLLSRYSLHSVDARVVSGLPDEGEFSTEETGECVDGEENAVVVKQHFWRWINAGDSISTTHL